MTPSRDPVPHPAPDPGCTTGSAGGFERIVVVDWSANSVPKRGADSIWIAVCDVSAQSVSTGNHATRHSAVERIHALVDGPGRTLVGVDFSLGHPVGTADALGVGVGGWRAMWRLLAAEISDEPNNANNRFDVAAELNARIGTKLQPGPFWGCPPSKRSSTLTTTKVPSAPLGEWRVTETALRSAGYRPFSTWQLFGAGSVGSQSLLGVAALARLRDGWERRGIDTDVWPFTCGLSVPRRRVVIAEVWPSMIDVSDERGRVRDDLQVEALAHHLATLDRTGRLVDLFEPDVAAPARRGVEREEGWILGA